jgi:hypothetical protein
MIKLRRMKWEGHVARKGKRNEHRLLVGKPKGRDHNEDQDEDGWIILRYILERQGRLVWTGLVYLRRGIGRELL